ncbi:hypothetical protein NE857_33085 [Nocardiopsis exhalans]|uniref:Toxin-antitoxin system HicB family antitoxin n=1 Tax=Nocardiopsis exhalans TaxID=163604 RepID=A0ABY5D9I8_9ACTN|nr:hypothetical protein [Nocardiopsis exhalans]USY20004.1 hypothetical protein NE857_33085 [Nocardiopsis exhalans]
MPTEVSVFLEPDTVARARRAADRHGIPLNEWLARAIRQAADLSEARAVLEEHFAGHGEPTAEAEAERMITEAGVGRPVSTVRTQ